MLQSMTAEEAVVRCQTVFAHAWMVRTFVKHSDEVEDFPELMQVVRTVFDTARAIESKVGEPAEYLATLRKKISKLRSSALQFADDAPKASDHENFRQAVISLRACVAEFEAILEFFPPPKPPAMPASFRPKLTSSTVDSTAETPSAQDPPDD